jgi:hypothetical protein
VRGIVAKDEGGYSRVQIDLVDMRRSGQLPYGWIVDHTRWQRRPVTFDGIELDAIDPNKLRELVEEVIVRQMPHDQYEVLIEAEKSERTLFQGLAGLVKQLRNGKTDDLSGGAP